MLTLLSPSTAIVNNITNNAPSIIHTIDNYALLQLTWIL